MGCSHSYLTLADRLDRDGKNEIMPSMSKSVTVCAAYSDTFLQKILLTAL